MSGDKGISGPIEPHDMIEELFQMLPSEHSKKLRDFMSKVVIEYLDTLNYPGFHSSHEGYAVIKEEFDEFWEIVKQRGFNATDLEKELKQVVVMCLRFVVDLL